MKAIVRPAAAPLTWDLHVPGDKSISHRALMLGSIAQGLTTVRHLAPGADVRSTAACMRALGASIEIENDVARVTGRGLRAATGPLDCGNSGTTMRLLAGLLGGRQIPFELAGDASLTRRPMRRLCEPLRSMGMHIRGEERGGDEFPPLRSEGGKLRGSPMKLHIASAQVKSALLFAGLGASGVTRVEEPVPSRDHTERMLELMGARISWGPAWAQVESGKELHAADIDVPGDASSAAFVLGAALAVPGSRVTVRAVGMNPGRTGFADLLVRMGAPLVLEDPRVAAGEPRADLHLSHGGLEGVEISAEEVPQLIDELPLLAVLGALADGETVVRGARELRAKESDRIRAIAAGLGAMGGEIEELDDGFRVRGPCKLHGAEIDSAGDHRIAMALAIGALGAEGPTTIAGAEWADISFPGFWSMIGADTSS